MANKIIIKKSSVAAKVPLASDLEIGEISVNLADQKLYSKNASGTVILVGSSATGTGTVTSVSGAGTVSGLTLTGTVTSLGSLTLGGAIGTLNQSTTGNAATVTTNADLTGHITSVGNAAVLGSFTSAQLAGALSDETGTGAAVFATSPTLVTPLSNNLSAVPVASGAGNSLTIAAGPGVGTGAGGSLILQAGLQATSGGDGKVIVKQVTLQTGNLQEWQNSAGTALVSVDAAGRLGIGTASPTYPLTVRGAGTALILNDAGNSGTLFLYSTYHTIKGALAYGLGLSSYGGSQDPIRFLFSGAEKASIDWLGNIKTVGSLSFPSATTPFPNSQAVSNKALTSNVATLTLPTGHGYVVGSNVVVAITDTVFDGTYLLSAVTATTISYARTNANVTSAAATGTVTYSPHDIPLFASAFQRLNCTGVFPSTGLAAITGIAPPTGGTHVDGRMIRVYNVGTFNLTLSHNVTSTVANRFWAASTASIVLGAGDYADLVYDSTNNGSGVAGWKISGFSSVGNFANALSAVPVVSGAGNSLTIAAGSGVGAFKGGDIILQPGAQGSSGGNGKVIVGSTSTRGQLLLQNGTNSQASEPAFVIKNAAGANIFFVDATRPEVAVGATLYFGAGNASWRYFMVDSQGGFTWRGEASATSPDIVAAFTMAEATAVTKSNGGDYSHLIMYHTFSPASGASPFAGIRMQQAINQTGTASGIIRGLYVDQTLTSVLGSYRAIETKFGGNLFNCGNPAYKGLTIVGAASQTANLQEWQNSAGTALAFMDASGNFNAITKSFNIPHPTKEGGRLRYASLEGPENSVYVRGSIKGVNEVIIYLPEYWPTLVHEDSLTVQTTAVGFAQPTLFVKEKSSSHIVLSADGPISVDYMICAERRDVPKLEVES